MLLRQELLYCVPVSVHLLLQRVASTFQALSFSIRIQFSSTSFVNAKSFFKAASFSAFFARLSEVAVESLSLFGFPCSAVRWETPTTDREDLAMLILHRLSILRFDCVDPSCLFLRECMVANLRLIFVRNLVVRLRNVQTIRDHEEYLLASGEECNNSRQASVSVDKWSWVCLIYRCFWLAPGPPEFFLRVDFQSCWSVYAKYLDSVTESLRLYFKTAAWISKVLLFIFFN